MSETFVQNATTSERLIPEQTAHQAPEQLTQQDILLASVRRCDYFADDASDEFQIIRENGDTQGIFKVWAAPIIPVLDTKNLDVDEAMKAWSTELETKPLSLFESLDQWRAYSTVADRRLQEVFKTRPIPADPVGAAAELYGRLNIAFAYAAPFYNLEALVADSREGQERQDNPIDLEEEGGSGGKLDAVAMVLPAALQDLVQAERLDWRDLNWETINTGVTTIQQDFLAGKDTLQAKQYALISKVANLANIEPSTVVFAANMLQFIPADVGGKVEDMPQQEALETLELVLDQSMGSITTGTIAKDINALIRFLNWSPAIVSDENFVGKDMTYAAVCATSTQLIEVIKANPDTMFSADFASVFTEQLAPQLDGLDADSAKGRFLLQLLSEGRLQPAVADAIETQTPALEQEIHDSLEQCASQEKIVDIQTVAPTLLVGGKATGLRKAIELFGQEKVVGGHVITSEAITNWLGKIDNMNQLIEHFTLAQTVEEKIYLGEMITEQIHRAPIDAELTESIMQITKGKDKIVLRSSSYDEDVDLIGPAPGVYESAINIDATDAHAISNGLKTSVISFFSDKAISFRELKGLRHQPLFSVLVQEFMPGAGGSIFVQNGAITLNIAPSPNHINGSGGLSHVEDFSLPSGAAATEESALISQLQVNEIVELARKAEVIFGPTDMEFVIDPATDTLKLLQLRSLERPPTAHSSITDGIPLTAVPIDTLDNELPDLDQIAYARLEIGREVDLEKFQGALFRWVIANRGKVQAITLHDSIPRTCHFANIMESLGIRIQSKQN